MNTKSAAFPMLVLVLAPVVIFLLALECIQPALDYLQGTNAYVKVYSKYYDFRYKLLAQFINR